MRVLAFVVAFLVLLGYGAFGWVQRRFALWQVAMIAGLTGLLVGVFLGLATEANAALIVVMTSFFTLTFAVAGTLVSWPNRKAVP